MDLATKNDEASIDIYDQLSQKLPLIGNRNGSEQLLLSQRLRQRRLHDHRTLYLEKWGRIRLVCLSMSMFFVIYVCFSVGAWSDQQSQIIVRIPPNDDNLPGPKAIHRYDFSTKKENLTSTINNYTNNVVPPRFLVWGPGCQIPSLDPLAPDVMKLFEKEKYEQCSLLKPLTSIRQNWTSNTVHLVYHESFSSQYAFKRNKMDCCYQEIQRSGTGKMADDMFNLTACISFTKTTKLQSTVEFILVKCKSGRKIVYKNTHAIARDRPDIRRKLNEYNAEYERRPLSVLMLSIDSISRLNLMRAMPLTAQHLYDNGWFELQGYNKIDDNTYPNLMAILVGYNHSLAYDRCKPTIPGKLEKCPFIWNDFRNAGYVTAYGEDEVSISSFNFHKVGFIQPPTDFYLRPYMLAAHKNLSKKTKHSLTLCLGNRNSVDHIYQYAIDFATAYQNDPFFGLFWTNTFSHNDISDPSSMDEKMRDYIVELGNREILNQSMVIFFSDHGMRFGPVRKLPTGWYEERLPFIFFWLPEWFRDAYPDVVRALKINRNRLTNPYDLHMTLKHIIELSGRKNNSDSPRTVQAVSCPQCQSIFKEMSWNRSCENTAIAGHWCTCSPYKTNEKNDAVVRSAVKYVLDYINAELIKHSNGSKKLCADLKLKQISYAKKAEYHSEVEPFDDYMIVFEVSPSGAWLESTVRQTLRTKQFEITGSVSRLNVYASQSACMKIDYLRKYCYCLKQHRKK